MISQSDLVAVDSMLSTASIMRWRAESVPTVMSVPQKSLSIEPTIPDKFRWLKKLALSGVTLSTVSEQDMVLNNDIYQNSKVPIGNQVSILIIRCLYIYI